MLVGSSHSDQSGSDADRTPLSWRTRVVVAGLLALYACLVAHFAWVGGDPYLNNDEPRQLLTGAFWSTFFTEWPVDDPVGFAERYYAQYPSLGLLVSPPLFHMIEGGVFRVFGVGPGPAHRLMTVFFAVLVVGWWFWVRPMVGTAAATWSALLLALIQHVFSLAGHVMLEIPLLAWMIGAVLAFRTYLEQTRGRWLWVACACATAAALTRFHAPIVVGPLAVQFLLSKKWHVLRRPAFWTPVALAALVSGSYCAFNLLYYDTWHSLLSVSAFPKFEALMRLARSSLGTAPAIAAALGVAGIAFLPLLRRRIPVAVLAWLICAVLMWVWLAYRPMRFLMYAWPAAVTLGVYVVFVVAERCRARRLGHVLAGLLVVGAAWELHASYRLGLRGYGEAAARAMAASQTRRVFIHGRQDGSFIWGVRQRDPELAYTVFRASKTLSSGDPYAMNDFRVLLETEDEMVARLDALGVDVVVSEDWPEINVPPYRVFMDLLASDRFDPIGEIKIQNPEDRTVARRLMLYRFHRRTPVADEIAIPLTALGPGHEIRVDLSRPLRGWRRSRTKQEWNRRADVRSGDINGDQMIR